LKCPVCSGKLDFDMKLKLACCHSCGWEKIFSLEGSAIKTKIYAAKLRNIT
jgi:hypothetical protein